MGRLLYFPTIDVPKNAWLRQSLLYWDGISSMVPADFWDRPEQHQADMLEMVRSGVVSQEPIYPHTSQMPRFAENFIKFLEQNPREAFSNETKLVRVHVEKLGYGQLGEYVLRKGLAKHGDGLWMLMEPRTANDFMAYLATCVANRGNRNRFVAATDDRSALERLKAGQAVRMELSQRAVEALLPSPSKEVDLRDIVEFREANKPALDRLRKNIQRRIEKSVLVSPDRALELFDLELDDLKDQARYLATQMSKRKWGRISFGSLTALGSAVLGAEPLLDGTLATVDGAVGLALISATAATVATARVKPQESCIAYAALAEGKFG